MIFEKQERILFIGDSMTDYSRARPVGQGRPDSWGTSYMAHAASMIVCAYPELNLHFMNVGISGNQIRDLDRRWDEDVMEQKPDWVSVLIGINDVWRQFDCPNMVDKHVPLDEFEATYEKLVEKTLPHVKGMILMTPYFMEPNKQDAMRARMDEYGAVVKRVAEKYNLIFVDLQSAWDELFRYMHPCNIAWDRIHPNVIGHTYIAKQFLKAIGADKA